MSPETLCQKIKKMKNEKNILHTQVILFELTFQTRCSRDTYGNTINRQEI